MSLTTAYFTCRSVKSISKLIFAAPFNIICQNLENVLKNPLKMEKIRIAVAAQINDKETALKAAKKAARKDAKREKKDAKKEKKESKDKKRARSTSSSRSPSRENQVDSLLISRSSYQGDHKIDGGKGLSNSVGRDWLGNKYHDMTKNSDRRDDCNSDENDIGKRGNDRRRERSRDDRGNGRGRDGEQRRDDDRRRERSMDDRGNSRGRDGEQRRDDDRRQERSRDDRGNSGGRDGEQRRDDDRRRERSRDDRGNGRGRDGEQRRDSEKKKESIRDSKNKNSSEGERKLQRSGARSSSRSRDGGRETESKSRDTCGIVGEDRRKKVRVESSNAEKSRNVDAYIKNEEVRMKSTDMVENKKYGLLGRDGQSDPTTSNRVSGGHLGPSLSLLAKRAEEDNLSKASRNKPRENVKIISDVERKERIRQMEEDASTNSDMRLRRIQSSHSNIEDEKVDLKAEASFLNSLRTEVYITNETSMTDRLQQNKYYMQKGTDLDSSGFMKK